MSRLSRRRVEPRSYMDYVGLGLSQNSLKFLSSALGSWIHHEPPNYRKQDEKLKKKNIYAILKKATRLSIIFVKLVKFHCPIGSLHRLFHKELSKSFSREWQSLNNQTYKRANVIYSKQKNIFRGRKILINHEDQINF